MKTFITAMILIIILSGCSTHMPLQTVENVDLKRYTGKWIEIARYDNHFEKGCHGATAHYTLNNGRIDVLNQCYDSNGNLTSSAKGKAHAIDESNSKLKVTFFWPFYGDYQVLILADDYRYSVIGEPSRKYFWILSRNPVFVEADKEYILSQLPLLGYDPSKLYWTTVRP